MVDVDKILFISNYDPKKGGTLNESVKPQPLRMWNGYVVLQHDSSNRITNGVIDHTGQQANGYSKNSDMGNYFWASPYPGKDPSNTAGYHYYCLVKPEFIYDIDKNPKGYESTAQALENEQYVSGRWHDGAIAVMTLHPTPISYIETEGNHVEDGGLYDAKWHMLRCGVKYYDNVKNRLIARKLKPYKDVPVPDFFDYFNTYEDMLEPSN